jgi:hypothetical protein
MDLANQATRKKLWRGSRRLLWAFILAFAFVVWAGLMTPPEPVAAFMAIVFLIAALVVLYHVVEWLQAIIRKAGNV